MEFSICSDNEKTEGNIKLFLYFFLENSPTFKIIFYSAITLFAQKVFSNKTKQFLGRRDFRLKRES